MPDSVQNVIIRKFRCIYARRSYSGFMEDQPRQIVHPFPSNLGPVKERKLAAIRKYNDEAYKKQENEAKWKKLAEEKANQPPKPPGFIENAFVWTLFTAVFAISAAVAWFAVPAPYNIVATIFIVCSRFYDARHL
jgi:hypothetical protein